MSIVCNFIFNFSIVVNCHIYSDYKPSRSWPTIYSRGHLRDKKSTELLRQNIYSNAQCRMKAVEGRLERISLPSIMKKSESLPNKQNISLVLYLTFTGFYEKNLSGNCTGFTSTYLQTYVDVHPAGLVRGHVVSI